MAKRLFLWHAMSVAHGGSLHVETGLSREDSEEAAKDAARRLGKLSGARIFHVETRELEQAEIKAVMDFAKAT